VGEALGGKRRRRPLRGVAVNEQGGQKAADESIEERVPLPSGPSERIFKLELGLFCLFQVYFEWCVHQIVSL
jgi:hypothetical protein